MRPKPLALLAAIVGLGIAGTPGATPVLSERDEIVDIKVVPVPIDHLVRITRADGKVFYTSRDRRWLITGDVIDLWSGTLEAELEHYNQISWARTGSSVAELHHPGWVGVTPPEAVIFVSHDCQECAAALQTLGNSAFRGRVAPVPIGRPMMRADWDHIWCQEEMTLDIMLTWIQTRFDRGERACDRPQVGRAIALAQVFGMTDHEPTLVDADGFLYRGLKGVKEWIEQNR